MVLYSKKSYPLLSEVRNEIPMWGTFQGNNQRTGYQGGNNLSNSNENKFNLPIVYKLHQNYPNPFNPTTSISYDLPKNEFVSINVFDLMGREVKTLVNKEQVAGFRSVKWDATNNIGQPVSAGMYIYTIQAGEFRQTKEDGIIEVKQCQSTQL